MGSIRELIRKNGQVSYHATVRLKGYPHQRRACRTKTQAKKWIQDTESSIRDGRYKIQTSARQYTVKNLIDRFITQCLPKQPKYFDKKVQLLIRWKEELGDLLLIDLSPSCIAQVRDKLLAEITEKKKLRTPSTVNRYLSAFSKVLSVAVKEWGWLDENPTQKVSKEKENKSRERFLSIDEKDRLLEACKASKNAYLYPIVLMALLTGMRYGEIVNLKWVDINFNQQSATLQETKNGDRRVVPLPDLIIDTLKKLPAYGSKPQEVIFQCLRGSHAKNPVTIRKSFLRALRVAGIENFRFHDLRHTAASYLAMGGATQGELMYILGHRSPQMTYRYAHFSRDHIKNILKKNAENFISSSTSKE